jgi:hypothetical protein
MHQQDAAFTQRLLISVILICMQQATHSRTRKLVALILLFAAGPLFVALTDPTHLPLPLVIIPFAWLFTVLYVSINFVIKAKWTSASQKRRYIIAGVGGALPVLLLVFESIHQLTARDFFIAAALVACISFYMARADFIK